MTYDMSISAICTVAGAVVGAFTLLGNIILFKKTYEQTERINHSNSMAKYYNVIFGDFLIYKIPEARRYIRFEDERLTDFSKLVDELDAMLRSALYFKYTNRDFYKELKCKINELESYFAECGNNRNYEQDEQAEEFKIINEKIEAIYKCVNDAYEGNTKK